MGGHSYTHALHYKDEWDSTSLSFVPTLVAPRGGPRARRYNGGLYRLPLRRQLLLYYHDSETMGAHGSAEDALAKLSTQFVWPGTEHDVQKRGQAGAQFNGRREDGALRKTLQPDRDRRLLACFA
eukprot:5977930-Pyramimonas_sp.AAC.1